MSDSGEGAALSRTPQASAPQAPQGPADEGPLRVEDIVADVRRRLRGLSIVVGVEAVLAGAGVGALLDESVVAFGAIGAGGALGAMLVLHDLGHRLDQPPRGLNLVRNRLAAALLLVVAAPALPWVRRLERALRAPVLASYAVANHPDYGRHPPEVVLATIRVRSAYVLLRNVALLLTLLAAFLWAAWLANVDYGADVTILLRVTLSVTAVALVQLALGVFGVMQLAELRPASIARVRRLSWLLWPFFPFGTYAAWSTRRAFGGGT